MPKILSRHFANFLSGFCLLLYISACNKSPVKPVDPQKNDTVTPPGKTDTIVKTSSIQAIGGTNQTDSIGKALTDSVIIKINEPGSALNKFAVQIFRKTRCNTDTVSQVVVLNRGRISFKWTLANQPGIQTLKFAVLDSNKKTIDSIKVTATALPPAKGIHLANCLVQTRIAVNFFTKISTGRIFAGYSGDVNPVYSDDNGITWHELKSFYRGYYPWAMKMVVLPGDDIFIATELNGVLHSTDKGATWADASAGLPTLPAFIDLAVTPDGKMFFTTQNGGIYTADKANNWTAVIADGSSMPHKYLAALPNSDILFAESTNYSTSIVKLDHVSKKFSNVTGVSTQLIPACFYVANNGNWYVGGSNPSNNTGEIYQSADSGISWNRVFESKPANGAASITKISFEADRRYYISVAGVGYYNTVDFKSFQVVKEVDPAHSTAYFLTDNNYFLYNDYVLHNSQVTYRIWYIVP